MPGSAYILGRGWGATGRQCVGASRALSSIIGITDIYLQGLGVAKSQEAVYTAPVPSIPATALLAMRATKKNGARA